MLLQMCIYNLMENIVLLTTCADGSCCCLASRTTVVLVSITSLGACLLDLLWSEPGCAERCCALREHVLSAHRLLVTLFQAANLLLLAASAVKSAFLIQVYVWYTLGFVVMGLVVALLDFLFRMSHEGARSFLTFVPDVVFLFAIFRCLPLVDTYRKQLDADSIVTADTF